MSKSKPTCHNGHPALMYPPRWGSVCGRAECKPAEPTPEVPGPDELAAIRARASGRPAGNGDWGDDDRAALLRMVDELRCGLIEAETREGMQESYAKDLAAELEGLRKENAELTKDVAVMSANEASYQKEIDELRAKLADTEKDRDAYVIELEQMRAELAETEARLLSIGAIDKPTQ